MVELEKSNSTVGISEDLSIVFALRLRTESFREDIDFMLELDWIFTFDLFLLVGLEPRY